MQRDLDGRIAVVTGGSRGIGRSIAEVLAEQGAAVAIAARDIERGRRNRRRYRSGRRPGLGRRV